MAKTSYRNYSSFIISRSGKGLTTSNQNKCAGFVVHKELNKDSEEICFLSISRKTSVKSRSCTSPRIQKQNQMREKSTIMSIFCRKDRKMTESITKRERTTMARLEMDLNVANLPVVHKKTSDFLHSSSVHSLSALV